jgi:acyl carrier protein
MTYDGIATVVKDCIKQIAKEQSLKVQEVEDHHVLMDDLGFTSLDVATLAMHLEDKLGVDPFTSMDSSMIDLRTVKDIIQTYEKFLK